MQCFYRLLETHLPTKIHLWSLLEVALCTRHDVWLCMRAAVVVAKKACHFHALSRVLERWKPNDLKLCGRLLVILDLSFRVEVRAGSQIATMLLHRLLFILRLSSCWLQLPTRYISGTGVVGSPLQWWKQLVKWSGSGEFLLHEREQLYVKNGQIWGMGVANPLGCCTKAVERSIALQLLDLAGRKSSVGRKKRQLERIDQLGCSHLCQINTHDLLDVCLSA